MYKLHRYLFERDSRYFANRFATRSSEAGLIELPGNVPPTGFDAFLTVLHTPCVSSIPPRFWDPNPAPAHTATRARTSAQSRSGPPSSASRSDGLGVLLRVVRAGSLQELKAIHA